MKSNVKPGKDTKAMKAKKAKESKETKGSKEVDRETKALRSRKSSAYHVATKKALAQGLSPNKAKLAGKKVASMQLGLHNMGLLHYIRTRAIYFPLVPSKLPYIIVPLGFKDPV